MSDEEMMQLLEAIKNNSNLYSLLNRGYKPSQISSLIKEAIEGNNCVYNEGSLRLTQTGEKRLARYYKQFRILGLKAWVRPRYEFKMTKAKKYDIVVPKSNIKSVD